MDTALATSAALPGLTEDDRILLGELRRRGVDAAPVVWEDPYEDWGAHGLCMIRSCWDYAYRRDAFTGWAAQVNCATTLWNPAEVVAWNTHKAYLLDLERKGAPIVPTVSIARGEAPNLVSLMEERGWSVVVAKPAVGASARQTMRVARGDDVTAAERRLKPVLAREDLIVQPYVPTIPTRGELSVMWIDGKATHAVRKIPEVGDFRIQQEYGGTVRCEPVEPAVARLVEAAVAAQPSGDLQYARVDFVETSDGEPMLMELELVEPELFFARSEEAVDRMAAAVERHLEAG